MALKLSPAERVLLAQDLWDSIVDEPDAWTLTDEQRALLDERLAALEAEGQPGQPWREVIADLRSVR
jgi:putative addiction module component (TIGR02574 family)